ncbi:MAG: hypothetical protein K2Y35_05575 [Burkholderiales bacterium]|nr:hypothetical protein [Burkholderiales bacterium]
MEKLAERIERHSPEELRKFREWFAEFDAQMWNAQIEANARAGKLDRLVSDALADYKTSTTREL